MDGDFVFAPDEAFVLRKPVVCVPFAEYEQTFERIRILSDENKALRRQLVKLRRGGGDDEENEKPPVPKAVPEAPPRQDESDAEAPSEASSESDVPAPPPVPVADSETKADAPKRMSGSAKRRSQSPNAKNKRDEMSSKKTEPPHQPRSTSPKDTSKSPRKSRPRRRSARRRKDAEARSPSRTKEDRKHKKEDVVRKRDRSRSSSRKNEDRKHAKEDRKRTKEDRSRSPSRKKEDRKHAKEDRSRSQSRKKEDRKHKRERSLSHRRSSSRKKEDRKRSKRSPSRRRSPSRERTQESDVEDEYEAEDSAMIFSFNAVQVTNRMLEVYNEKIENNTGLEQRQPRIKKKLASFLEAFHANVKVYDAKSGNELFGREEKQVVDAKSGKKTVVDKGAFVPRYECIFRESGAHLSMKVNKRFFFETESGPSYCLDFEQHESVVTAQPGTRPDGSLGVLPPRSLDLIVLYEVENNTICRMWLASDKGGKLGRAPTMDKSSLMAQPSVQLMLVRVGELVGEKSMETHFHNYLIDDTVIG